MAPPTDHRRPAFRRAARRPSDRPSPDPAASATALVEAVRARHGATWYRTLAFVQETTFHTPDGPRVQTWFEAAAVPGRLRIDFDRERLVFVRLVERQGEAVSDTRVRDYRPLGGGWIAPTVEFYADGVLAQTERSGRVTGQTVRVDSGLATARTPLSSAPAPRRPRRRRPARPA